MTGRPVRIVSFAALLAVLTVACTTIRTHSDFDPQANFTAYESFAWIGDRPLIRPQGRVDGYVSPLNMQRIEKAIESELSAKGYRQIDDREQADFVVSFTVGARDKIDIDSYPSSYHGTWGRRWPYYDYGDGVEVHTYTEGVLAIDIFDKKLRQPVWHGVGRKRITGSDIEDSGPLIKEAVSAILSEFPPG